jgi:pectinesterase
VGFVTAPSHDIRQAEGFRFRSCAFTAEEGVPEGTIFLARPWRDYGMCSFTDCSYGSHIAAEGFDKWQGTARDRTARFYETPEIPGRVSWINRSKQ